MAKPIKNELRTARTAKISHARGHAKREDCTVIEESVFKSMGVASTRVEDVVVQETGESASQDPQREGTSWLWWY